MEIIAGGKYERHPIFVVGIRHIDVSNGDFKRKARNISTLAKRPINFAQAEYDERDDGRSHGSAISRASGAKTRHMDWGNSQKTSYGTG